MSEDQVFPVRDEVHVAQTDGDVGALGRAIRSEIAALAPSLPVARIATMDELLSDSMAQPRFNMAILLSFALCALLLASVGIYGVMAYSVARRTHEIGVRMALGADRSAVRNLIVRQGMVITALGLGTGVALALIMTRVLESLLFGVSATDPLIFGGVIATLAVVSMASNWFPALQASRGDPSLALRQE